jgi:pimeloyl-ACP methyl ester carboxylesterase
MKLPNPHSSIVNVAEQESAPWMTMVHAASHDQRFFSAQINAFQQDYRLLLVDLPGHGKSAAMPGPYGFEEYATSVLAAMEAAGVEQTHYLGTHTGAAVGLMLAIRHRERFQSLMLESVPLPGCDLPSVVEAYQRACTTARSRGVETARAEWFERGPWFENIRKNPERCRAAEHWAMVSEFRGQPWVDATPAKSVTPLLETLAAIQCPVLIINGEHDVEDFQRAADQLEQRLARVRRVRIAGAGGFPLWEEPDAVNALIREHLQDAGAKS